MNSWEKEAERILKLLNGHAYLKDIYEEFLVSHKRPITKSYDASLRDALEKGSVESSKYDGKPPRFYMIDGKNKGHYGLINNPAIDLTQDDDEFSEGKRYLAKHIKRERNTKLINEAKKRFIEKNGRLYCEVCGFDFEKVYGKQGENFIEAHHIKPVSQMNENEKTKIEDLVMVCSNCHSMMHRKKPWITKDELKQMLVTANEQG